MRGGGDRFSGVGASFQVLIVDASGVAIVFVGWCSMVGLRIVF